jgi:hypothetical protein
VPDVPATSASDQPEAGHPERHPAGLFDGFEGYVTPTEDDYRRLLTGGTVVPDTNALLNLYRYTAEARDDLFAVLERLRDQLWVPHQVIVEFWRNREAVLRDPRDTHRTMRELDTERDRALKTLQTWANRVSLTDEHLNEIRDALALGFRAVTEAVAEFTDTRSLDAARDTNNDAVLARLAEVLDGRVGPRLSDDDHTAAVDEGLRRVDERRPPGYMDKNKDDDGAAGDYLVWEEILREAERRGGDVLFVTGDVKEDWWREEGGEKRGPRLELVEEMRRRSGGRLFILRPASLLLYASKLLEVTVREGSVQDAERVERFLSEGDETLPNGGWTREVLRSFLARLATEAPVQDAAVRLAASQDGFVSREQVYELGNYPEVRSLRGFTRPTNRIAQQFRDEGVLPDAAVDVLLAVYNDDSPSFGWAAGFRIHEDVLGLFESVVAAPAGHASASGSAEAASAMVQSGAEVGGVTGATPVERRTAVNRPEPCDDASR